MRAGVLQQPGFIEITELDDPVAGPNDAVILVSRSGVCGTDRAIFRGDYGVATPIVLGHEYSGTVVSVGENVGDLRDGDRVVVDPNVVDDHCFFCRRGHSHLCSGLAPLGVARSGGFAELSVVPARYLYVIPDDLSLADAALVEPLACCIRGIDQAAIIPGDTVVIAGAGPIGCLLIQLARLSGASHILSIEPNESRHDFARRAGADVACTPREASAELARGRGAIGADVVIEASGNLESAEASFDIVRRGGTIVLFGVYPEGRPISVSPYRINEDELRVVGSLNNPNTHDRALDLLATGRLSLEGMVTDVLPLDELAAAMVLDNFVAPGKIAIDLGAS
jgi:2-desacetyl-2-hydroxyethyl bacteriochlorophyllide A dehydrogenase